MPFRRWLWQRPLTLIFRARRAPAQAPRAVVGRCGGLVVLAPRLELTLNLWTKLGEEHRHATLLVAPAAVTPPTTAKTFLSRHLHFHTTGVGVPSVPAVATSSPAPGDASAPTRSGAAAPRNLNQPTRIRRNGGPTMVGRLKPAQSKAPRAAATDLPRRPGGRADWAGSRSQSATMPAAPARLWRGSHLLPPPPPPPRATASASPFPFAAPAGLRRGMPVKRHPFGAAPAAAPAADEASVRPGAGVRSRVPPPPLELAGPAMARDHAAPHRDPAASRRPPPPLDHRRPASPVEAVPSDPAPRAAPPSPAPAIDLEALSREVIIRIEKRLRVERERHGRA